MFCDASYSSGLFHCETPENFPDGIISDQVNKIPSSLSVNPNELSHSNPSVIERGGTFSGDNNSIFVGSTISPQEVCPSLPQHQAFMARSNVVAYHRQADPNMFRGSYSVNDSKTSDVSYAEQHSSISSNATQPPGENLVAFETESSVSQPSSFNFNPNQADTVEQLLDKADLSNTVLDRMLRKPDHCQEGNIVRASIFETDDLGKRTSSEDSGRPSSLTPTISLSDEIKAMNCESDLVGDVVHSSNVTSETDAFFSDLQEILARDMPLLNTSTPKEVKHANAASLTSADSGHESWSSSSSGSTATNSASLWGQQEMTIHAKSVSPLSATPQSGLSVPSNTTEQMSSNIFENHQTGEQAVDEQVHTFVPFGAEKVVHGLSTTFENSGIGNANMHRSSLVIPQWSQSPDSNVRGAQARTPFRVYANCSMGKFRTDYSHSFYLFVCCIVSNREFLFLI